MGKVKSNEINNHMALLLKNKELQTKEPEKYKAMKKLSKLVKDAKEAKSKK